MTPFIILKFEPSIIEKKTSKEEEMKETWMSQNNLTLELDNISFPNFDYYDYENHFFLSIYPYMIVVLQEGIASWKIV